MRRVRNKLQDNGGVTILMAIFALLVAAMVSTVILSAAVSSVKQAKDEQATEQNILTLQSAGELVADNIEDASKTSFIHTVVTHSVQPEGGAVNSEVTRDEWTTAGGCIVESKLLAAVQDVVTLDEDEATSGFTTGSFDITASATKGDDFAYSETVRVDFVLHDAQYVDSHNMAAGHQLIFALTLHPSTGGDVQTLYLVMTGEGGTTNSGKENVTYSGGVETWDTTTTTTYSWKFFKFYRTNETS